METDGRIELPFGTESTLHFLRCVEKGIRLCSKKGPFPLKLVPNSELKRVYRPSDRRAETYAGCVRRRCCPWWVTTALTSEEKTERTEKHRIDALKARSQHMKRTELTWTCRHNYAERHAARQRHDILRTYWLKTLRSELGRVVVNTGFSIGLFTLEVVANCSSGPFASCERGFTLLWPSDPVTRESSDPETQLTR